MKKLIFLLTLLVTTPALASTDVNFDTTATGTTSSYLANSTNMYWQDNSHSNLSIGNNNLQTTVSQSGGGNNGSWNMAIGLTTLTQNTTGFKNTAIGVFSGSGITTGSENTALGYNALDGAYRGDSTGNTAIGSNAMGFFGGVSTANNNTGIGINVLSNFYSGSNNTVIGANVGSDTGVGSSGNILIGTDNTVTIGFSNNNTLNIGNAIRGVSLGSTPNIGIGSVSSPTARLHLPAGTAAASTAPIKLTPGTLLTTPEDGALEYDGTHLYFTIGSTRSPIL